jgi:hypothetical protein
MTARVTSGHPWILNQHNLCVDSDAKRTSQIVAETREVPVKANTDSHLGAPRLVGPDVKHAKPSGHLSSGLRRGGLAASTVR